MISLDGVCKSFGDKRAVDQVSCAFAPGRLTGFLGPNGAGKSTVIRMVMNILAPDRGRISVAGQDLDEAFRNRIGYLPEERGLYKSMQVIDHLVFFGCLKGLRRDEARRRGLDWLERMGLADRAKGKVEELSKGMQQKIQFAATLLHDPELILMDEPFSGLDPVNTETLKDVMLDLKAAGKTLIFSTHMMDHADRLCDEIALINRGKLVLSGNLREIRSSFGRRHLRVEVRGATETISDDDRVESFQSPEEGRAEVVLRREEDVPRVIRDWSTAMDLLSCEVIFPGLTNIFMRTVESSEKGGES